MNATGAGAGTRDGGAAGCMILGSRDRSRDTTHITRVEQGADAATEEKNFNRHGTWQVPKTPHGERSDTLSPRMSLRIPTHTHMSYVVK